MSKSKKHLFIYLGVTVFCGLFSFVYEHFSHQVYSNYMVYLFAIPLVLGVLPQLAAVQWPKLDTGGSWQKIIQSFAVATLSVGSALQGVVEIYGTTSSYILYFFIVGFCQLVLSVVMWVVSFFRLKSAP